MLFTKKARTVSATARSSANTAHTDVGRQDSAHHVVVVKLADARRVTERSHLTKFTQHQIKQVLMAGNKGSYDSIGDRLMPYCFKVSSLEKSVKSHFMQ